MYSCVSLSATGVLSWTMTIIGTRLSSGADEMPLPVSVSIRSWRRAGRPADPVVASSRRCSPFCGGETLLGSSFGGAAGLWGCCLGGGPFCSPFGGGAPAAVFGLIVTFAIVFLLLLVF